MRLQHGPGLASLKSQLKAGVNAEAEVARARFGAATAPQLAAHAAKRAEALAFLRCQAVPMPWLLEEVRLTGRDLRTIAEAVAARAEAEAAAAPTIEAMRVAARAAIDAADTIKAARAAAVIDWPTP